MKKLPLELNVWYTLLDPIDAFKIEENHNRTGYIMCDRKDMYIGQVTFKKTVFEVCTRMNCAIEMKGIVKYKDIKKLENDTNN